MVSRPHPQRHVAWMLSPSRRPRDSDGLTLVHRWFNMTTCDHTATSSYWPLLLLPLPLIGCMLSASVFSYLCVIPCVMRQARPASVQSRWVNLTYVNPSYLIVSSIFACPSPEEIFPISLSLLPPPPTANTILNPAPIRNLLSIIRNAISIRR